MAKMSNKENGSGYSFDRVVRAVERLAMVIGAVAVNQFGDVDLPAKAKRLQRMGFSNTEIASMLSSTANSVGVALHKGRKRGRRKTGSRKRR